MDLVEQVHTFGFSNIHTFGFSNIPTFGPSISLIMLFSLIFNYAKPRMLDQKNKSYRANVHLF